MNYVEATEAPLRKTGQIKLHGPNAFAGMRKAGALAAECLDLLVDEVKPGVPTSRIDDDQKAASATMMSQALTMARAFGALQARMLDHACAELEATLPAATAN